MRNLLLCSLLLFAAMAAWAVNNACHSIPRQILGYSTVSNSTAITLNWQTNQYRTELRIGRRLYTNNPAYWQTWTNFYTNLNATTVVQAGTYNDTNITVGLPYEYRISSLVTNWICDGETNLPTWSHEYINTGIQVPLKDTRGNLVLLVENGLTNSLASELSTLTNDLTGEGYKIFRHNVAAKDLTNSGWFNAVTNTKALVRADWATDSNSMWTIFIVGHVPIPYAGLSSPGGHLDNFGAHPADWYYADMSAETNWTDATANDVTAAETNAWNVPGDGKFDQSVLPTGPEMSVGRIDLRNMPAFPLTEVQLLQQYFARNHQWRHKQFTVRDRSLIITSQLPFEVHANYSSFFGSSTNTDHGFWMSDATNASSSYLFAASFGNGHYDQDFQIGYSNAPTEGWTTNIAKAPLYIVFATHFGSYYGDWDSWHHTNSVMQALLADSGYVVANLYHDNTMVFDSSSLGEPIGQEMFACANNYFPSVDTRYLQSGYIAGGTTFDVTEQTRCFVSLLGDPTLKARVVAPPTNTTIMIDNPDKMISWGGSTDTGIVGYHIYRAPSTNLNQFTRLTSVPTNSPYRDTNTASVAYTYMVRAIKLDGGTNRSFYNVSQGSFQSTARGTNYYVSTTGNNANPGTVTSPWLTGQHAADTMLAGDCAYFASGRYQENVRCDSNAGTSESARIIFEGQNVASIGSFTWEAGPYLNIQNFTITHGTNLFGGFLYVPQIASHCVFSNNICDAEMSPGITPVFRWNGPASAPFGTAGSYNLFVSNVIKNVRGEMGFRIYGYTNTFVGNQLLNFDNTDYFQVGGATNYIIGNLCSNLFNSGSNAGNHADFVQVFGDAGGSPNASWGHIIESNLVIKMDGVAQLGNLTDDGYAYTGDLTYRNNQFIGVGAKVGIAMPYVRFYHNLFDHCFTNDVNGGHGLLWGNAGSVGIGHNGRCYGNIFNECGIPGNTNNGWYQFDNTLTNVSADYNYVSKSNHLAIKVDPTHRAVGSAGGWDSGGDWWENHGINGGDPKFVSEALLNFRLLTNSSLIDAGTNLTGIVATDYDGTSRPQGAAWDIGAFEYQSGSTNGGGGGGPAGPSAGGITLTGKLTGTGKQTWQ